MFELPSVLFVSVCSAFSKFPMYTVNNSRPVAFEFLTSFYLLNYTLPKYILTLQILL